MLLLFRHITTLSLSAPVLGQPLAHGRNAKRAAMNDEVKPGLRVRKARVNICAGRFRTRAKKQSRRPDLCTGPGCLVQRPRARIGILRQGSSLARRADVRQATRGCGLSTAGTRAWRREGAFTSDAGPQNGARIKRLKFLRETIPQEQRIPDKDGNR
jgi:hypothetical protein